MFSQHKVLFQFPVFGAPVRVRAAVLFNLLFLITYPPGLFASLLALVSILLIVVFHLLGHAATARALGRPVYGVDVLFAGGTVDHAPGGRERDGILIAWGGVIGQAVLFVMVFVLCRLLADDESLWGAIAAAFFNIFVFDTIFTVVYNLLPFPGLDGGDAWRFISLLRSRRAAPRARILPFRRPKKSGKGAVSAEAKAFANKMFEDMMKKRRPPDDPDGRS